MSNALELKVVFAAIDKFIRPVKAITGAAGEAAKALRDNTARMKEYNRTIEQIDAFKKVEKDAAIAANTFAKNRREIDALKSAMERVGVPTKAMSDEMARLGKRSDELKNKHQSLLNTEQALFEKLKAAGIDTSRLAEHRRQLASSTAEAANASRRLQSALEAENQKMRRLRAAQADLAKSRETAGKLAMAGAGISAAGVAVGVPLTKSLKDFGDFETAMLGVAKQMDGTRDANGRLTKTYWEMADAIKEISERLPGSANDIAKIVEGGARMGIQGRENLLKYAEATAIMAQAFDIPTEQIGKDMGTVAQLYKVPIANIKDLGDTINWLDDQTLAQGADIIEVMKRINGVTQQANMSYREAAALGSTFLSIGSSAEVAASATQAMIRELGIANMQSKRFRGGLSMLGLDGNAVQKGMSTNATGTLIMVLEKIKALSGDKQLEATTRLFGKEYGDDAARLAENLDKYREALRLVNDEKAKGSMDRELSAWQDTLAASTENTRNTFNNLSTDLGKYLKGAAVETLDTTMRIVKAMRDWSKEHPKLSSALITTAKWLTIGLSALGLLAIGAGAVIVPLAMLKFSLSTLGVTGAANMSLLSFAIRGVGLALKATGIGLLISLLITGAVLIYENWDKVKALFTSFLDGVITKLNRLKENLRYLMPGIFGDLKDTPTRASTTQVITASPMIRQVAAANNYSFNITQAPGTDNRELARQISAEIERIDAKKAAGQRSRLRDPE
ncbi:phage tail tape measure protein [Dechloromonas denitrificans]|uniref:phage tail tape measure protein n=1 Tax=Dechloromonas denitrificans TaxID=281362 RepID=UPI001CF8B9B1|nr:phage tail tape measure protein [Dechloromonas denitrificans]UCV02313.1 phage tail tape measure protein [Dechloromonas denitrificans]